MQYLAFVFAIFGFMAYMEVYSLKGRVSDLEEALTATKGTTFHEDRNALLKAASAYVGKKVKITLKEEHEDVDIFMYGNTSHGSNVIEDIDRDWLKVHIETPKGPKDKLIRMEAIKSISLSDE